MGFVRPSASILVGTVLSSVALILQTVALAAPGWYSVRLGPKGDAMVGLWEYCYEEPKYKCEDIELQWKIEAWVEATRVFSVLGFLVLVGCVLVAVLFCFLSQVKVFPTAASLTALIAAALLFIEFSVFSGVVERRKNTQGQEFAYEYCFGLTIVAFILAIFASVAHCVGARGGSKKNREPTVS